MKKYILTVTVCIGLIGGGVLLRWLAQPPKDALEDAFLNNRTWEEVAFKPHRLQYFQDTLLLRPLQVKVGPSGIYISDAGDTKIKRFDFEGGLLNKIGLGKGQGPGELQFIMDFDVNDRDVWMADSRSRLVSHFSIAGDFYDRFGVSYHPLRVHRIGAGIVVMGIGRETLFELFDEAGTPKRAFGQFFEDQRPDDGMVLHGFMISWRNDGFVYVPSYTSKLYYYNNSGNLNKAVMTVDGDPDAFTQLRIQPKAGQTQFMAPKERHQIHPAGTDAGKWYMKATLLLVNPEELDPNESQPPVLTALDWYDEAGHYISSTELPLRSRSIWVYEGKLYALAGDTALVAYDMIFED